MHIRRINSTISQLAILKKPWYFTIMVTISYPWLSHSPNTQVYYSYSRRVKLGVKWEVTQILGEKGGRWQTVKDPNKYNNISFDKRIALKHNVICSINRIIVLNIYTWVCNRYSETSNQWITLIKISVKVNVWGGGCGKSKFIYLAHEHCTSQVLRTWDMELTGRGSSIEGGMSRSSTLLSENSPSSETYIFQGPNLSYHRKTNACIVPALGTHICDGWSANFTPKVWFNSQECPKTSEVVTERRCRDCQCTSSSRLVGSLKIATNASSLAVNLRGGITFDITPLKHVLLMKCY